MTRHTANKINSLTSNKINSLTQNKINSHTTNKINPHASNRIYPHAANKINSHAANKINPHAANKINSHAANKNKNYARAHMLELYSWGYESIFSKCSLTKPNYISTFHLMEIIYGFLWGYKKQFPYVGKEPSRLGKSSL